MTALRRLTVMEAKLLLRDPAAVVMALAFPMLLIVVLGGVMPGFRTAVPELAGLRPIDVYLPVVVALAVAGIALNSLPTTVAAYRERGVLRRMATTPVRPVKLLGAQLLVSVGATTLAVGLAVAAAAVAFRVPMPEHPVSFLGVFLLGSAATFAVGLLIAALVPTGRAANAISMLIYFPMLFFAGVWTPGPMMPETIRRISDLTPLGALSQTMQASWSGAAVRPLHLLVMAGYLVVVGALAARLFRWR
ncbi:ABC transporter permease [Micromonospora sp. NBC_01813]|uniref:ABC transporter permease n=1 Tax=Micromonospora sp. NBC_01813 TaxID=2975988 RepID=UPI002DD8A115|nr:ABC transporter permease [Micromonospora sp. NBC_01813]WSA08839.1 ABC transporter permease [Micromonospora sp. NBC_01813]